MGSVFLLLGSNLGERLTNLIEARRQISRQVGKIVTPSGIYRTAAWGDESQPDFFNQAIEIEPFAAPHETLRLLLAIENKMGRVRNEKWGSRVIDIDILLWGNDDIELPDLIIPHPHLHQRKFVLVPLAEIAPQAVHPLLKKNVLQLLDECTDALPVSRVDPISS
jgi:2-amino-4-hydroxy-6-hydroxymethyldihydropteridine diphosphokinase